MTGLDTTIVNIALPRLRDGLGFSPSALSWVVNAYMLAYGGFLILGGRAGDILGRKRVFGWGVLLFSLASVACGLAPDRLTFVVARALQGLGAALIAPNTLSIIASTFAEGPSRNRALALYSITFGLSGILGLALGGAITQWLSWRWIFFINAPIGAAVLLGAPGLLQEPERHRRAFDLPGALLVTLGLGFLSYGFIDLAQAGPAPLGAAWVVGLAVLILGLFVLRERNTEGPLLPPWVFTDRNRAGGFSSLLFFSMGNIGIYFFITQYLQDILHFRPIDTGLAILPLIATLILVSSAMPKMLKRVRPRLLALSGASLQVLGALLLLRLGPASSYWGSVLLPMVILGLAGGFVFMPLNTAILGGVPSKDSGAVSGTIQTLTNAGGALGLSLMVAFSKGGAQSGGAAPIALGGIHAAFLTAGGFASIAFLCGLTLMPRSGSSRAVERRSAGTVG
jgi:EmrB/QacA subfamily drug resistance transporter